MDVPCFSSLSLYPNFPFSFFFLLGFVPSSHLMGVVPFIFSVFFFSFGLPYLFVTIPSFVLSHSSVSSIECFAVSFLGLGFLPSSLCLSSLRHFGCRSSFLGSGLFLWAFLHLSCASSPSCWFQPWAFPSLPSYSPHSSSLFLSTWYFLYFLGGFSSGFSSVSSSSGSLLLSFLPFCRAADTPSSVSHPLSFHVLSFHALWYCFAYVSFLPAPALRISLLLNLAVSFRSRSLFACPRSPVRSFSRTSFLFVPSGSLVPLSGVSFCVLLWLRVLSSRC